MDFMETGNPMDQLAAALTNYEWAKKLLCVEVVGAGQNTEMLENVPHKDMEDLAMTYRIQLGRNEDGIASVLVTNELMEGMGVTAEQLHADALDNSARIRPPILKTLDQMLEMPEEMEPMVEIPKMLVLTNEDLIKGAAVAFYPEALDNAAKEIGGSFFVLPSSVHEVLLLPDDGMMKTSELKQMVTEINRAEVLPNERLTDSVYHFDAESRTFELGEKYEKRMEARDQEKGERSSVLKDLQDKRSNMNLKPKPAPHRTNAEPVL